MGIQDYDKKQIKFVPYDPNYPKAFQVAKALLNTYVPEVQVEHIGSTSIPGVSSNNIIDILMLYHNPPDKAIIMDKFRKLNFQEFANPENTIEPPDKIGAIKFKENTYNIHIFFRKHNSPFHIKQVLFRDILKQDENLRNDFNSLKNSILKKFELNSNQYQIAKDGFIQNVLKLHQQSLDEAK